MSEVSSMSSHTKLTLTDINNQLHDYYETIEVLVLDKRIRNAEVHAYKGGDPEYLHRLEKVVDLIEDGIKQLEGAALELEFLKGSMTRRMNV